MSPERGTLARCPECGSGWPAGPDHALRGCGWLHGLDRHVSPSNGDVQVHDGSHGVDRFLQMELKSARETWPIQPGQFRLLRALAAQQHWTVLVLRGDTRRLDLYQVTRSGIGDSVATYAEAVRRAVNSWLQGRLWRDAQALLQPPDASTPGAEHICGWARVDGLWTCIQDQYAIGHRPDTACGATAPEYP